VRLADVGPFDPTSTDFYLRPDYHAVLAALRAESPVYYVGDDLAVVTRYEDVREISRDPERFCSGQGALVNDPIRTGRARDGAPPSILFVDPPQHARQRGLVNRKFTPRAVGQMEADIRAIARTVFDRVGEGAEPIDAVEHLTAPIPLLVIAELLGIPDGDRSDFRRWSDAVIESSDRPVEDTIALITELHAFLTAHLEAKLREPGDDLVSMLGRAELDGRRLGPDDVFSWLLTLLVAGNETTRTLLSGGMVVLAEHPDQRARLAADPTAIPIAVEECLRWVTPIQTMCRTVVADTTLGGTRLRSGDYLIMMYASANRDEAAYGPTAGSFDAARPVNPAHLAFGFGEHLCLGAALARMEARIFFEELLTRFPDYQIAGSPVRVPSTLVCGIASLPVALRG